MQSHEDDVLVRGPEYEYKIYEHFFVPDYATKWQDRKRFVNLKLELSSWFMFGSDLMLKNV